MKLRAGDWVEVRSKDEIFGTLDKYGRLEELPFMPQMFKYCGQRFRVFKRAHKTCDTVNPIRGRRVSNAVHLDLRCDGEAYGGCQAFCLIFWKVAWLKPANEISFASVSSSKIKFLEKNPQDNAFSCTEDDVWKGTRNVDQQATDESRYICQATQLPYFTTSLRWWDIRQYWEDYSSGNVALGRLFRGFVYSAFWLLSNAGIGLGRPLRWFYDVFEDLWGPYPGRPGEIPPGQPTPTCSLNLQPGDMVRVKSYREILATLDKNRQNRGLLFDAELVPYCGDIYRVKARVNRFINEKSGKLVTLKGDAIILENVWCQSIYSNCRMFCPRSIYSWWREIWLERVPEGAQSGAKPGA